jgi:hypothetical protein
VKQEAADAEVNLRRVGTGEPQTKAFNERRMRSKPNPIITPPNFKVIPENTENIPNSTNASKKIVVKKECRSTPTKSTGKHEPTPNTRNKTISVKKEQKPARLKKKISA